MDEKKRSEIHLVNRLVGTSKTPGVKKGSNAYIYLDTQMMYEDGIEMYYSEDTKVIFTRGVPTSHLSLSINDVVEPKYITSVRTTQGESFSAPTIRRWNQPSVPTFHPPVKRKATPDGENRDDEGDEERGATFTLFSPNTAVAAPTAAAAPCKMPSASMPPPISPARVQLVPTVVKAPPAVPSLNLGQRNTEPSVGSGTEVPVLEPVPYKDPPGKRPLASLELNKGSQAAFVAPMGSETEGPIVLPSGSASVPSETEFIEIPKTAKVPPPPPAYPAMAHAKLPAGVSLPETGTKATAEELRKIAGWLPASSPLGKGIIRPQPDQAEQDFKELIPSWLQARGLTQDKMEFVGLHNGWLEYHIKSPAIKTPGAEIVAANWNDETKWPNNWVAAYHGGRWYGAWSICSEGFINISKRGAPGNQAGGGDGHYCAVDFEYARWYSRAQDIFNDGCYHRVMFRLAYDKNKLKNIRYVSQGLEHIVWENGIVLLSCLMKPNYPPVEATEERFSSWDPSLEIHPKGLEHIQVLLIENPKLRPWGPWDDYRTKEKKRLQALAQVNRASAFTVGFGEAEPLVVNTDYFHAEPLGAKRFCTQPSGSFGNRCRVLVYTMWRVCSGA
jgi:hypothetical protein